MAESPFPRADRLLVLLVAVLSLSPVVGAAERLRDAPVAWYDDDRRPFETPVETRDPNLFYDFANETVFRPAGYYLNPVRNLRRLAPAVSADKPAPNVNRLGEVPNSSWFTNRIGLYPMTADEVARGPNTTDGPSREGGWTIVAAKTEGVTPGFTIVDATGQRYLIKFGPVEYPVMPTAAAVISQRLFHAIGYWVPEDDIVFFRRKNLSVSPDATLDLPGGGERPMNYADIDEILARVEQLPSGLYRAVASRFLPGRPVGPFDYLGTRSDDPNDRIKHQRRRELRGLKVFAEWVNHFDTKQQNTLDVLIEHEEGGHHLRHYLIDFASTLGTGAYGPIRKFGWEAVLDPKAVVRRTLTLGLLEDDYRLVERPDGTSEIGWFDAEHFTPQGFEPPIQNPAFMQMTERDAYWAAKILSAFTDEHLRAVSEEARYRDSRSARAIARILADRRDRICRAWFDVIPPLDFFVHENGTLRYRDLGHERGIYVRTGTGGTPRYRARVVAVDAEREPAGDVEWVESEHTVVSLDTAGVRDASIGAYPFVEVEVQVDRGEGWSASIRSWIARRSGRVVEVHREKN